MVMHDDRRTMMRMLMQIVVAVRSARGKNRHQISCFEEFDTRVPSPVRCNRSSRKW
jgi:hypothetical protein